MRVVTACAPVNIAVVKYWGKRDDKLILPLNGSVSLTLDPDIMCAKTSAAVSPNFESNRLWLNGVECPMTERFLRVLEEIKKRSLAQNTSIPMHWKVHVCSVNNFPTAAGLASSAAGLACLAFALSKLYNVDGDISDIARLGSGSACRSVYGGFVEWIKGEDGKDSIARQIADVCYWQNMAMLILVINAGKKHMSSTTGMKISKETSKFLKYRADTLVPETISEMTQAILEKDFHHFAELTMRDSNQMHAACLDSYPPIIYLTDTSRDVISLVHSINSLYSCNKVAYSFDAGPNACLFLMEDDVPLVFGLVKHFFPPQRGESFVRGRPIPDAAEETVREVSSQISIDVTPNAVSYVISTRIGGGPKELPLVESLLDSSSGLPLITSAAT